MKIRAFIKSVQGLSENSKIAYEQTLWQLHSTIRTDEPTKDDILKFLNAYSSSSLHRHKAAIKAYLEFTNPDDKWPFTRRQFAGRRHHIPRYVKVEIVEKIIDSATDKDEKMFVLTLFTLGCRISELMGIEAGDVTDRGVQVLAKGGVYKLKVITQEFAPVIMQYAQGKKGRLFPESYTYYRKTLIRLATAIGHPEISPHRLRHARAVDLLKKGMPLAFVQQFLGHANINTTAIYLEITGGELGDILQQVETNSNGEKGGN